MNRSLQVPAILYSLLRLILTWSFSIAARRIRKLGGALEGGGGACGGTSGVRTNG